MIPSTTERVPKFTHQRVNDYISERTRENVAQYAAASPQRLDERVRQLDHEWDVDRVTAMVVGVGLAAGAILTVAFGIGWVLVPTALTASLLTHAVFGWSPLLPVVRRLGFRTECEIAHERFALKALRGDFQRLAGVVTPQEREDLSRFENEGGPAAPEPGPDASDPHIVNEAIRAVKS